MFEDMLQKWFYSSSSKYFSPEMRTLHKISTDEISVKQGGFFLKVTNLSKNTNNVCFRIGKDISLSFMFIAFGSCRFPAFISTAKLQYFFRKPENDWWSRSTTYSKMEFGNYCNLRSYYTRDGCEHNRTNIHNFLVFEIQRRRNWTWHQWSSCESVCWTQYQNEIEVAESSRRCGSW